MQAPLKQIPILLLAAILLLAGCHSRNGGGKHNAFMLNSWGKNPEYKKCHYLAKYEGKPAGVITAVSYKGFVGIYNVGTIPQYRHLGVGKAMMSVVSKEVGRDDVLFLQTEKGSLVEKWYETMGFQTIFYGECYTEG